MRFHLEPDYSDTNGREGYKLARPSLAKPGKGCCNAYYLHTTHSVSLHFHVRHYHGLRTPNEGIDKIYLKSWADVADKICFGRTYQFRIGS
jgi:hypothetical protein